MTSAFRLDVAGLLSGLDVMAEDIQEAARPAAQAMAQVFYDEVVRNVSKIKRKTGNLASSIYQVYSQDGSRDGVQTYHVSWNARKAPHGHLVEYGHLQRYEVTNDPKTGRFITHKDRPLPTPKQIPGRPFIRPALVKAPQAQQAGEDRLFEELRKRGVIS